MENPFFIDWEEEKERLLKKDYRDAAVCAGVALILLPLPSIVSSYFHHELNLVIGYAIYGLALLSAVAALAILDTTRTFKGESTREATREEYEYLMCLCRKFPKAGGQCRAAIADILSQQNYLTEWQVDWLIDDLEELGDSECVEALKTVFMQGPLNQSGDACCGDRVQRDA